MEPKRKKDIQAVLDHFKRSTSYQKRNGIHNSHSVNYTMDKKADTQDEAALEALRNSDSLRDIQELLGKENIGLEETIDVNNKLQTVGAGKDPSKLREQFTQLTGDVPGWSQPANTAKRYTMNAVTGLPQMYALNHGGKALLNLAWNPGKHNFMGRINSSGKALFPRPMVSQWNTLRAGGGTIPGATKGMITKGIPAGWQRMLSSAKGLIPAGSGLAAKSVNGLSAVAKRIPYFGGAIQLGDYVLNGALKGESPVAYGQRLNDAYTANAMNNPDNSAFRGVKDSLLNSLSAPFNIASTSASAWNVLSGESANRRAGALEAWRAESDRASQLTKKLQQLRVASKK